jgi:preprotein translocase subunit SecG
MNIFVLCLPAAVFLLILYFALSKKSGPAIRKAALITLIILTLCVIVSLALIFNESAGVTAGIFVESEGDTPVQSGNTNVLALVVFVLLFLLFLGVIIFTTLREYRETVKKGP